MTTYQLLQIARDEPLAEGRTSARDAVLEQLGVDGAYVRRTVRTSPERPSWRTDNWLDYAPTPEEREAELAYVRADFVMRHRATDWTKWQREPRTTALQEIFTRHYSSRTIDDLTNRRLDYLSAPLARRPGLGLFVKYEGAPPQVVGDRILVTVDPNAIAHVVDAD